MVLAPHQVLFRGSQNKHLLNFKLSKWIPVAGSGGVFPARGPRHVDQTAALTHFPLVCWWGGSFPLCIPFPLSQTLALCIFSPPLKRLTYLLPVDLGSDGALALAGRPGRCDRVRLRTSSAGPVGLLPPWYLFPRELPEGGPCSQEWTRRAE